MTAAEAPAEFVSNVPFPLTAALVHLAPCISLIKHAAEIISWRSSWYNSWLAIAAWWAICLLADPSLRYFLPIVILCTLVVMPPAGTPVLVTEHVLQAVINDLAVIHALLPVLPRPRLAPNVLLRLSAFSYLPYLLLTHLVPLRILLALFGTTLLILRAPWAALLFTTLHRSTHLRALISNITSRLTGTPLPQRILSNLPTPRTPAPTPALRFLFTLYENQRWWVGLDWTAALLPAERPSWCTAGPAHHPVSPPAAFALPTDTTVFLPAANGAGRVRRTAHWRWEEPEWRVVVRGEGAVSHVERSVPRLEDGAGGSKLLKAAAGKLREVSASASTSAGRDAAEGPAAQEQEEQTEDMYEDEDEGEVATDPDGWVYGDNKWEGQSGKGGIGKYTRYRRWTRIAVVTELVDVVKGDGPVGIQRALSLVSDTSSPSSATVDVHNGDDKHIATLPTTASSAENSPLRSRIRHALSKGSVSM